MSTVTRFTAEQLLHMPDDGYQYELFAGELNRMSPAGWKHGWIAGWLHVWLGCHVEEHNLGAGFGICINSTDEEIQQAADQFLRACKLTESRWGDCEIHASYEAYSSDVVLQNF